MTMRASSTEPRRRLLVPWMVFAGVCSVLMWMFPGEETVPYHLGWLAIALAYGIEAWPWRQTVVAITAYTVITGAVMVYRAGIGVIALEELPEIPLMATLVLLVVWNARKRHVAFASLALIAQRDRVQAARRERLSRMTSHEMRTPATIAIGYAELLLAQEVDPARRADLQVIREELNRLVLVGDRLIRSMRMSDHDRLDVVDLRELMHGVLLRWSVLAERNWEVNCEPITHVCSAERLRSCLDTLLENAVRYTEAGDTVRLLGIVVEDRVVIGVADSGPGMNPLLLRALNGSGSQHWHAPEPYMAADPQAQTGLGLNLVHEGVLARGGRLAAGVSAEGGALVTMVLPRVDAQTLSSPLLTGEAAVPLVQHV